MGGMGCGFLGIERRRTARHWTAALIGTTNVWVVVRVRVGEGAC